MVKHSILCCFLKNESDEVSSICTYKKDMKKESKRMTIQKSITKFAREKEHELKSVDSVSLLFITSSDVSKGVFSFLLISPFETVLFLTLIYLLHLWNFLGGEEQAAWRKLSVYIDGRVEGYCLILSIRVNL